jgi:hypothetical protein
MGARQISSNTISALIGAAAFAVLTAGTAVAVSTTAVTITNPTTGVVARVTGKESLVTSERDASTGAYAKVDAAGKRLVGDGSGALTVDGSVANRPVAPATIWAETKNAIFGVGYATSSSGSTAPASGRLWVRNLGATVKVPSGQSVRAVIAFVDHTSGFAQEFPLPLTKQGTFAGEDVYIGTMAVDLYPKPSSIFAVGVTRSATPGDGLITFSSIGQML